MHPFIVNAALSQLKDDLIALHKRLLRIYLEKKFQKNIINLENKTTFTGKKNIRFAVIISTLIVKCFSFFFFLLVYFRVFCFICISLSFVIVFFISIIEFDFEWKPPEPQFVTYVKICAKYARAKNTNEKLPQCHLTPSMLRFALKRQTEPQTAPADPQNRSSSSSASSFIGNVVHRSFRCLSSPRVVFVRARTHARAVSWHRRVLGAQHDCRNGKQQQQQPALTQLYPRPPLLLLHSLHLHLSLSRLSLSLAASLAVPLLLLASPRLVSFALSDVFNAKQAAVKRMFVAVVFFGGCSSIGSI